MRFLMYSLNKILDYSQNCSNKRDFIFDLLTYKYFTIKRELNIKKEDQQIKNLQYRTFFPLAFVHNKI